MIVKKYRLDLGERHILARPENEWLTEEERSNHKGYLYCYWNNSREYLSVGRLINAFEEYLKIGFPLEWEDKIIEVEYDVPEGEFVLTKCFPSYGYSFNDFSPNRNLFRHCKSVSEVLEYLEDSNMETFRIVLGQFRLERPLTTLYVTDHYNNEKRCWKYPGA